MYENLDDQFTEEQGTCPLGNQVTLWRGAKLVKSRKQQFFLARFRQSQTISTYIKVSVNICNTIKHSHHSFWNKWWWGFLADFVMIANSFYGSSTGHFCVWIFWLCGIESFPWVWSKFEKHKTQMEWCPKQTFCTIFLPDIFCTNTCICSICSTDFFPWFLHFQLPLVAAIVWAGGTFGRVSNKEVSTSPRCPAGF